MFSLSSDFGMALSALKQGKWVGLNKGSNKKTTLILRFNSAAFPPRIEARPANPGKTSRWKPWAPTQDEILSSGWYVADLTQEREAA